MFSISLLVEGEKMVANPNRRPIEILALVSRCWITIDIDKNQMSRHKIRIELRIQLHFVTYGFFCYLFDLIKSYFVCMRMLARSDYKLNHAQCRTRIPNVINKIPTNGKLIHFKELIVHRTPCTYNSFVWWLFLLLFCIRLIKTGCAICYYGASI